jgi:hypothetical protein
MKSSLIFTIVFYLITTSFVNNRQVPYVGNPIVEHCVACKFIWENVQEALVDSTSSFLSSSTEKRNPILAAQSFQYFCRVAPDLFFEACNIMFEKLFFLTQDFCAKKSVMDICVANELCPREFR